MKKSLKMLVDIIAIICIAVMAHCVIELHKYSIAHPNVDNSILLSKREQFYLDNIGRALLPFAFGFMWITARYYVPILDKYPRFVNSKWFVFLHCFIVFLAFTWGRFFWN